MRGSRHDLEIKFSGGFQPAQGINDNLYMTGRLDVQHKRKEFASDFFFKLKFNLTNDEFVTFKTDIETYDSISVAVQYDDFCFFREASFLESPSATFSESLLVSVRDVLARVMMSQRPFFKAADDWKGPTRYIEIDSARAIALRLANEMFIYQHKTEKGKSKLFTIKEMQEEERKEVYTDTWGEWA